MYATNRFQFTGLCYGIPLPYSNVMQTRYAPLPFGLANGKCGIGKVPSSGALCLAGMPLAIETKIGPRGWAVRTKPLRAIVRIVATGLCGIAIHIPAYFCVVAVVIPAVAAMRPRPAHAPRRFANPNRSCVIEQFDRTMRENFTTGSLPFRKTYLQSLINVIKVGHPVRDLSGTSNV